MSAPDGKTWKQEGGSHLQVGWLAAALHLPAVAVDTGTLFYDPRCRAPRRHDHDHGFSAGEETCRHSRAAEVSLQEVFPDQGSRIGRPKPPVSSFPTTLLLLEEA